MTFLQYLILIDVRATAGISSPGYYRMQGAQVPNEDAPRDNLHALIGEGFVEEVDDDVYEVTREGQDAMEEYRASM